MGMGWESASGGIYCHGKCSCGKGSATVYISDHDESEYPPFTRNETYSVEIKCPDNCERNRENLSKSEVSGYSILHQKR